MTAWQSPTRCQPLTLLSTLPNQTKPNITVYCGLHCWPSSLPFTQRYHPSGYQWQLTICTKKRCNFHYRVLLNEILQVQLLHCKKVSFDKMIPSVGKGNSAKCWMGKSVVEVSVVDPIPHIITPPPAHPSPLLSRPSSWSSCWSLCWSSGWSSWWSSWSKSYVSNLNNLTLPHFGSD